MNSGELKKELVSHNVVVGLDIDLLLSAESQWSEEKSRNIAQLLTDHSPLPDEASERIALFAEYGLTDFHWDWTKKAFTCASEEYIWMFLVTPTRRVQAIAIFYHPKASRLDGCNIFYVDYIATAYWNRGRDKTRREFSGAALKLIRHGILHLGTKDGYRTGFCLHSLPTAVTYYEKLGMTKFEEDPDKENLVYFEASKEVAASIVEAEVI